MVDARMHAVAPSDTADGAALQSQASILFVDLDGTLTPTDTLLESLIQLAKQSPRSLLRLPLWLAKGRAAFKSEIAARVRIAADRLPYRPALLGYLRRERAAGRRIVLATAAHASIAHDVSAHLGLFDAVIATERGANLKGPAKHAACRAMAGTNYVYAGDSAADKPVWAGGQAAILVAASARTAADVRKLVPIEKEFPKEHVGVVDWLRALRVHQWLKNLLLFVPLLTAFEFTEPRKIATAVIAFQAFSLVASASYVANDLWDLENDRAHPRKRLRPFASGKIGILQGLAAGAVALALGLALAAAVNRGFVAMLLMYLALTTAYSWVLKKLVLIDVLTLSLLYTLRTLAGAVAIGVAMSPWLLAFSGFMFLSLALVKRCSELTALERQGAVAPPGRDYQVGDLAVLRPLGIGAALSAVVVFGLFINTRETLARYATPQLLWLSAIGLTYWLGRLWIMTSRGEVDDDPIVYAITNRGSQRALLAIVATVVAAYYMAFEGVG